ncbi:hypothetical protein H4582DRAFT_2062346 [Lactarius indigo]|nr:hypothetical protein H4582DRAFT_2062346 [Lactarius indigo]
MLKIATTIFVVSNCCLPKTCVGASPVPPYAVRPPQATERSPAARVLNEQAHLAPSSSSSGLRPTLVHRDQMITDERPTPTIPQAKQQQQNQEEKEYTSAMPSSNGMGIGPGPVIVKPSALPQPTEVLAQMGSCDLVVLEAMPSLGTGGASATDGTALPMVTTITPDVLGTFLTTPADVATGGKSSLVPRGGGMDGGNPWDPQPPHGPFPPGPHPHNSPPPTSDPSPPASSPSPTASSSSPYTPLDITLVSSDGTPLPPAAMQWAQCILVIGSISCAAISKVWNLVTVSRYEVISKVRSWVSRRGGFRAHKEQPGREACEDKDDTPEYDESIAPSTTMNGSLDLDKCPKSSSSPFFLKLMKMLS